MVAAITNGIKVSVETEFQPFYSDPLKSQFAFSYKIRIENNSEYTIQLMSRKWIIFDSIGQKYIVEGEGVVGVQPIIEPGYVHEYVSGCNFKSTIGQMKGVFYMEKLFDGKQLEVQIPEFTMIMPHILN